MPNETVVITGVGIVSSIGIGQSDYFDALVAKTSGVRSLAERTDGDVTPAVDETIDGVWIGAPLLDFEPKQYVRPRKALKVMCREIQTAFASATLAIEHAELSDSIPASESGKIAPNRVGVVYGSEIFFNPPEELTESFRACMDADGTMHNERYGEIASKEVMPLWMLKYLPNMPACQVGISVNSQGPNNSLVLGDVSGPAALFEAASYLDRGLADLMLVGATGTRVGAARLTYRGDFPIPTVGDHAIEDASRPHDPEASGVVGGEAAATLMVETAEHAAARSAPVLATVLATASRFSPTAAMATGKRCTAVDAPQSRGASDAIRLAINATLDQSGIAAEQIGLVVSHAAGDRQVDSGEAAAIAACGIDCPAVAIAASIGHTGAASGMMGLATGALALANRTIPPTRHAKASQRVKLCDTSEPLQSPYVLCLSHTTDGSAMAVLLGAPDGQ